jgi:predicted DNA-binding mobile mystery protein A
MSLRQLAVRLNITPQSVKEIEQREANGSITIKSLQEVGAALDLRLVYGFISKHESIEAMIEQRAVEIARDIVSRTSKTMELEEQGNSRERLEKAITNRAEEIKRTMPKYLWD